MPRDIPALGMGLIFGETSRLDSKHTGKSKKLNKLQGIFIIPVTYEAVGGVHFLTYFNLCPRLINTLTEHKKAQQFVTVIFPTS